MKFKIIYHVGDRLRIDTKLIPGKLSIDKEIISISGQTPLEIKLSTLKKIELFRLHGLGSIIEINNQEKRIFITIPHLSIAGFHTKSNLIKTVNIFKTIENYNQHQKKTNHLINADEKYFCNKFE